tara:strand:- start:440 stop:1075 length:636 start_codon:yes stop_codon:yes gene_type:complete
MSRQLPVGWTVNSVIDLVANPKSGVQTGPFGSLLHSSDYVNEGVPVILIRNIKDGSIDTADLPRISEDHAEKLGKFRLRSGDIVFSRVGRVGSCFRAREEHEGWVISGQTLRIRFADNHDTKFLVYVLSGEEIQSSVLDASVGTTRTSLNTSILENLQIKLPPPEEQERIAEILGSVDEQVAASEKKLDHAELLKKSLMQDLLTGKVRVAA